MDWKDTSDRQRGTIWDLQLPHIRVTVHRFYGMPPELWFLSCHNIGIEKKQLEAQQLEEAKTEAIAYVTKLLKVMLKEVGA
jgi:hypothetical protein